MVHGWIATLADEAEHQLSVMTQDASVGVHPDVSVFVDDVYDAFYRARRLGMDIVSPVDRRSLGCDPILLLGSRWSGCQCRDAYKVSC